MKIALLAALFLLASCAPLKPLSPQQSLPQKSTSSQINYQETKNITGIAAWDNVLLPWLGTPYLSGGNSKNGVDCSGFVSKIYMEKEGMSIPRSTTDEYKIGKSVNKNSLVIGDLVFFGEKGKVNHVGIFVGNGNFIHASTSRGVMVSPLDDIYWKPLYIGARRYL